MLEDRHWAFTYRDYRMVYFSTYANPLYSTSDVLQNPLYYTSDLLVRGFTAAIWTCGHSARPPSLS